MGEGCMAIKAEVDFQLLENQRQVLQAAALTNSDLAERLRSIVAAELKAARDSIVASIRFKNGDPRGTAHAIRRSVYQKLLGGNINILDGRGGGGSANTYEAPRKVYPGMRGHRGGNRRLRSQRTQEILSYGPRDRQFILRFVNSGTHPRYANGRNGKWNKQGNNRTFFKLQEEGTAYRGAIAPRNFFATDGERAMQQAVQNLSQMIEQEFNKMFTE